MQLKNIFSRQLTSALCHEVMTPLNSITNMSDLVNQSCSLMQQIIKPKRPNLSNSTDSNSFSSGSLSSSPSLNSRNKLEGADSKKLLMEVRKQAQSIRSLRSSSKLMNLMLCSQITSVKHGLRQLMLDFKPNGQSFESILREFLQPYQDQAKQSNLKVSLRIA